MAELIQTENAYLKRTRDSYKSAHADTAGIICWDSVTGGAAARAKADAGFANGSRNSL